jgi:mRNA-degrading endonuclease YafQ of YafQ-DinJ toxin-antitoxin module
LTKLQSATTKQQTGKGIKKMNEQITISKTTAETLLFHLNENNNPLPNRTNRHLDCKLADTRDNHLGPGDTHLALLGLIVAFFVAVNALTKDTRK